jgi:hypothetical protein
MDMSKPENTFGAQINLVQFLGWISMVLCISTMTAVWLCGWPVGANRRTQEAKGLVRTTLSLWIAKDLCDW